ncbi:trans-aconitate 2-methyltransferase [Pseudoroseicyclus sp. CXY001]|uniref:class I SAM-dependent methyltransferase n=1 Tax=Pseudoroseicyclus sp. CXY001 TaxID=3242492 RepID=UPI00357143C1
MITALATRSPAALVAHYDAALANHGDTARGACWPNEADRRRRFAVMAGVAPGGRPGRLLDIGCGTGGLLSWLEGEGRRPAGYLGLDLSTAALTHARRRNPGGRFLQADLLTDPPEERFDHVVASGLFTLRAGVGEAEMWDFLQAMVAAMWARAEGGIAFNVMSAVVDWRRDDLFHVPSDRLLAFLFKLGGRRVTLRNDYDLWEYTAYLHREPGA